MQVNSSFVFIFEPNFEPYVLLIPGSKPLWHISIGPLSFRAKRDKKGRADRRGHKFGAKGYLLAGAELEVIDLRAPDEVTVGADVLRGKPEGAVIARIYADAGIITPARVSTLGAGADFRAGLLRELPRRISHRA